MFAISPKKLSPTASRRAVTALSDDEQSSVPNKTTVTPKLRVAMFAMSAKKLSPATSRPSAAKSSAHYDNTVVAPDCYVRCDVAGESTALRETLLQGVDSEVAAVGPRDRLEVGDNDVAGNSPDVIEAPGECNPCGTGEQSKLLTCTGGDDQHICGDIMRCVVLSWSYLLFTWTAVVCAAKVTETHVLRDLFTEDLSLIHI